MNADTENIVFTELDRAMQPPCEFGDEPACGGGEAKWIMRSYCDLCTRNGIRLVCDDCKDARIGSDDAAVQCVGCGVFTVPARYAYKMVQAL